MSIRNEPIWKELKRYLVIEIYSRDGIERPRFRIVFRPMPQELLQRAFALTIPCLACGDPIHPIRETFKVYFAGSCPLDTKIACSRSDKISDEYQAIKDEMDGCEFEPMPEQMGFDL